MIPALYPVQGHLDNTMKDLRVIQAGMVWLLRLSLPCKGVFTRALSCYTWRLCFQRAEEANVLTLSIREVMICKIMVKGVPRYGGVQRQTMCSDIQEFAYSKDMNQSQVILVTNATAYLSQFLSHFRFTQILNKNANICLRTTLPVPATNCIIPINAKLGNGNQLCYEYQLHT